MRFLLMTHEDAAVWERLSDRDRRLVEEGRRAFVETVRGTGELVAAAALGPVDESVVVTVRDGVPVVSDGPYPRAEVSIGECYLVEVPTRERALELAAMIPDASVGGVGGSGVEVRDVLEVG